MSCTPESNDHMYECKHTNTVVSWPNVPIRRSNKDRHKLKMESHLSDLSGESEDHNGMVVVVVVVV